MIDQIKTTDLVTKEEGERFLIYMYVTGSDDIGTDKPEEDIIIDTATEPEAFPHASHE